MTAARPAASCGTSQPPCNRSRSELEWRFYMGDWKCYGGTARSPCPPAALVFLLLCPHTDPTPHPLWLGRLWSSTAEKTLPVMPVWCLSPRVHRTARTSPSPAESSPHTGCPTHFRLESGPQRSPSIGGWQSARQRRAGHTGPWRSARSPSLQPLQDSRWQSSTGQAAGRPSTCEGCSLQSSSPAPPPSGQVQGWAGALRSAGRACHFGSSGAGPSPCFAF